MPKTQQDKLDELVELFRALLDESLVVAIAGDHDLTNAAGYDGARTILSGLAQDVPAEEATGFNPSGLIDSLDDTSRHTREGSTQSSTIATQPTPQTPRGDSSSAGQPVSENDGTWFMPQLTSFNNETEQGKLNQLSSMFASLKVYDIQYALKKNHGDFQDALDDLLNLQYLQATGQQVKGIDGFFHEDQDTSKKSKKKKKNKANTNPGSRETDLATDENDLGIYFSEVKDQTNISYLAEHLNRTIDEVADVFYANNSSMSLSAIALLDQCINEEELHESISPSDDIKTQSAVLGRKYRHVPEKYLECIVQSTSNITQFSEDLACLLNKEFARRSKGQKLNLGTRLTPLPYDDIEGESDIRSASQTTKAKHMLPSLTSPQTPAVNLSQALQLSASHNLQRRQAGASAAQMYRKGASNPLFRQAAVVYSERAQEHSRAAYQATSTAADLLVDQQSRPGEVDLHGIFVQDGVRIARQKSLNWWQNLGDMKSQKAKQHPLIIITGVGRHSAGGVSPLRKAVAAALIQDGWKVEVGTGKFTIYGRI